jgi:hypothetical protein
MIAVLAWTLGLALLGVLALRFGHDSRPGFGNDDRSAVDHDDMLDRPLWARCVSPRAPRASG